MAVKKRDLYLEIRRNVPAKERKRLGITAKTPKKRLMEIMEEEQLTGSGLFDFITAPIRKVFAPREDFNNISKKTLAEYGDAPIKNMYIMRAPITGAINTALNIVSLGAWNRVRKEANYDKLFHLSLICEVTKDNQTIPIILEKNEVVHIAKDFKKYPGYETFPLSLPTGTAQSDYSRKVRRTTPLKVLTIRQLVENALKGVGRKTFFEYDAFNNNCQFFIMYLLQYSGLLTPQAKGFIYQPMEEVVKKIPGFVPKMARMLTDLAASWNKLSGQGIEGGADCGCGGNTMIGGYIRDGKITNDGQAEIERFARAMINYYPAWGMAEIAKDLRLMKARGHTAIRAPPSTPGGPSGPIIDELRFNPPEELQNEVYDRIASAARKFIRGGSKKGGQLAQRSVGTKGGLDRRQEQYRQLLVAVAIDQKFRAGEISRNEAERAKNDARSPIYQEALQRIDSVKQETGQTYEQLYRGAEQRYYETEEGKMDYARQEAEAEASALRIAEEGRRKEIAKFQKDFPVLAGIVEFGRLTAPITTEALKYVLSAVPGLPSQVRDGLNKGLQLASNIAGRDDVKDGQLDLFQEIGKVAGSKEDIYGGQRQNAQGIMKQLKAYALGDKDVQEKLPTDTKIVLYNDLAGVEDIAELMDEKGRMVMLYPRESPTVGHWVCMFENKEGDLEYFDPYGDEPEGTKRDLSPEKLAELGIEEDILIPLIKRSAEKRGKGVVFNSFQYQKLAPGINTCGRHCVSRLAFHEATADEYKKILDEMKKDTKKSYDDIVSILTEI